MTKTRQTFILDIWKAIGFWLDKKKKSARKIERGQQTVADILAGLNSGQEEELQTSNPTKEMSHDHEPHFSKSSFSSFPFNIHIIQFPFYFKSYNKTFNIRYLEYYSLIFASFFFMNIYVTPCKRWGGWGLGRYMGMGPWHRNIILIFSLVNPEQNRQWSSMVTG